MRPEPVASRLREVEHEGFATDAPAIRFPQSFHALHFAWAPYARESGSSDETLNLSRGIWMDGSDHLHIADAVGEAIRVYDVSKSEPAFMYNVGAFGVDEGNFRSPTDVAVDGTGRMYVADRNNSRVQVWSY